MDEKQLRDWVEEGKNLLQIIEVSGLSRNTVRKYLKVYGIPTPKGFYNRPGKKPGYPKGRPQSEEWIQKRREMFSGENNPFFGQTHTEETRERMRENHADFTGENNPFRKSLINSPEKHAAHVKRAKNRWAKYTTEERNKIRENFSKAQAHAQNHGVRRAYKHGFHISSKAGRVFYRSSWELAVAEFLDSFSGVVCYKVEPFAIRYTDVEGMQRYTRPDFLVELSTGELVMLEVKPESMLKIVRQAYKIAGQKKYCEQKGIRHHVVTCTEPGYLGDILNG